MNRILVGCFFLLFALPAAAQSSAETPEVKPEGGNETQAPAAPPVVKAPDQTSPSVPKLKPAFKLADNLDELFVQLKRTRDKRRAKLISDRIWLKWRTSDSHTIDLLTTWARQATSKKDYHRALDLLDQVVVIEPEYAEGWNQRATLHFAMQEYGKSIADIERTLALEPRHYGALAGLASIFMRLRQKERALKTWYRVLEVYPAMKSAQSNVLRLEEDLAGSGI